MRIAIRYSEQEYVHQPRYQHGDHGEPGVALAPRGAVADDGIGEGRDRETHDADVDDGVADERKEFKTRLSASSNSLLSIKPFPSSITFL